MSIFRAIIEKEYLGEYWTNVYHVEAADLGEAAALATQIKDMERSILDSRCMITKLRVDDMVKGTDVYHTVPVSEMGSLANTGTGAPEMLPLFVVVRVDFQVFGQRPSRKYLRGTLVEAWSGPNGQLNPSIVDIVRDNYATPLAGSPWYVDESGNPIVAGTVYLRAGMRQLRRGSKKKSIP